MFAGLPGTGIGGIYYLVMAVGMPLRKAALALRGKTARMGWGGVALQLTLAGAILATLSAEAFALREAAVALAAHGGGAARTEDLPTTAGYAAAAGYSSIASLLLVVLAVQFARLVARRSRPAGTATATLPPPAPAFPAAPAPRRRRFAAASSGQGRVAGGTASGAAARRGSR